MLLHALYLLDFFFFFFFFFRGIRGFVRLEIEQQEGRCYKKNIIRIIHTWVTESKIAGYKWSFNIRTRKLCIINSFVPFPKRRTVRAAIYLFRVLNYPGWVTRGFFHLPGVLHSIGWIEIPHRGSWSRNLRPR